MITLFTYNSKKIITSLTLEAIAVEVARGGDRQPEPPPVPDPGDHHPLLQLVLGGNCHHVKPFIHKL